MPASPHDSLRCCLVVVAFIHIAAIDLFVIPTIGFKLLYGLVILRLERRRLVWINVTAHPTAEWIARHIDRSIPVGRGAALPHPRS